MAIFGINGTRYALPASRRVWAVADTGEPGRVSDAEPDRQLYKEEAHEEIARNAERLVSNVIGGNRNALTCRSGRRSADVDAYGRTQTTRFDTAPDSRLSNQSCRVLAGLHVRFNARVTQRDAGMMERMF
jgi:hypothetical protein